MERTVVLGRGGAGKTTAAQQIGALLGVPVIELDQAFWSSGLEPTSPARWVALQQELAADERWVMDGDLGPHDVLEPRLARADTVIVLDFDLLRCLWRAARRSRERLDFWWWVLTWRRTARPRVLAAIAQHAPRARLEVFRRPAELDRFLAQLDGTSPVMQPDPVSPSRQPGCTRSRPWSRLCGCSPAPPGKDCRYGA